MGVGLDENAVDLEVPRQVLFDISEADTGNQASLFKGDIASTPPILKIPVLSSGRDLTFDQAKAIIVTQTATQVAAQLSSRGGITKAFVNIISNLKDLDYKSKQYSGDKARESFNDDPQKAIASIKDMHDSYDGLYDNFRTMFADVQGREQFKESNLRNLDEQKITANFLKKLIEESFKK